MSILENIWGWLLSPAVTVAQTPTTWIEILGFISGAICVALVAKQNIYNWPIGIINNFAFLGLFFAYGLYADGALQLVYVALAIYGWYSWVFGGQNKTHLKISNITPKQWAALSVIGLLGWAALWAILEHYTTSDVAFADSLTTTISLLAVWGQSRKKIQSWWLWITVDVLYLPLYIYKDLYLTAGLYVVFGSMCVWGLIEWTKQYKKDKLETDLTTETKPSQNIHNIAGKLQVSEQTNV